eukprot:1107780-Amphidinium_carterae.1
MQTRSHYAAGAFYSQPLTICAARRTTCHFDSDIARGKPLPLSLPACLHNHDDTLQHLRSNADDKMLGKMSVHPTTLLEGLRLGLGSFGEVRAKAWQANVQANQLPTTGRRKINFVSCSAMLEPL